MRCCCDHQGVGASQEERLVGTLVGSGQTTHLSEPRSPIVQRAVSTQALQLRCRARLGDNGNKTQGGKGASQGHMVLRPGSPRPQTEPSNCSARWLPLSEGFLKGDAIRTTLFSRGTRGWVTPAHTSQLEPRGHASQLCVQCPPWELELASLWGNLHHGHRQALQTGCFSPWGAGRWTLASATQLLKLQNSESRRKPNTLR